MRTTVVCAALLMFGVGLANAGPGSAALAWLKAAPAPGKASSAKTMLLSGDAKSGMDHVGPSGQDVFLVARASAKLVKGECDRRTSSPRREAPEHCSGAPRANLP